MSTHKNIFFIFFLQTGGSNLLRNNCEQLFVFTRTAAGTPGEGDCAAPAGLTRTNNCEGSGQEAASPDPIHPRCLGAASPAGPDSEQLCVFSSRLRLNSLPIPLHLLLPDQGRTIKTNNCEYIDCSRRLEQLRSPMPNLPPDQAGVLTPNNCRYSPRCRRLEPDPIPMTCT
jgi:hypothetical protein